MDTGNDTDPPTGTTATATADAGLRSFADPGDGPLELECPRCGAAFEGRYYGPCPTCVDHIRATCRGEAKDVEAPEYVPKMNVTPNAVALKE